jgi:hypothetical protein
LFYIFGDESMKILDCRAKYNLGSMNEIDAQILIDKKTPDEKQIYEVISINEGRSVLLYCIEDVLAHTIVRFADFSIVEEGFGRARMELNIRTDKGIKKVSFAGGWNSNIFELNLLLPIHCMPISYTDKKTVWDRGYTFIATQCRVDSLTEALKKFCPEIGLMRVDYDHQVMYHLTRKDVSNMCPQCKGFKEYSWRFAYYTKRKRVKCNYCNGTGVKPERYKYLKELKVTQLI